MRKLQVTCIYFILLLLLFFIPKPKSLLEMETYESKLRNNYQIGTKDHTIIVIPSQPVDTLINIKKRP